MKRGNYSEITNASPFSLVKTWVSSSSAARTISSVSCNYSSLNSASLRDFSGRKRRLTASYVSPVNTLAEIQKSFLDFQDPIMMYLAGRSCLPNISTHPHGLAIPVTPPDRTCCSKRLMRLFIAARQRLTEVEGQEAATRRRGALLSIIDNDKHMPTAVSPLLAGTHFCK